jgi:CBS domain-containing protein
MDIGYTVADAMTTKPVSVQPTISVRDASVVMREAGIGSLLVVDNEHRLVGILTTEDIVNRVTAHNLNAASTPVEDIMTRDIIDIRPEADITSAMRTMKEHDIFHLPVRNEEQRLLGFLTLKDLLRIEPELFEIIAEKADLEAHHPPVRGGKEGFCAECGNYASDLVRTKDRLLCGYCQDY